MHWGNCANYSGRGRRIEVCAPFLVFFFLIFRVTLNMQAFHCMRLGPGRESFELRQYDDQYGDQS